MIFQREQLSGLWDEVIPLLVKHWQEIAHYKDIPLDPDIEAYTRMEQAGSIRVFTARTDTGLLVGYVCYFIRNNAHYRSSLQAVQDVMFLRSDHRQGFTGIKLIKFADEALRAEGVQVVYQHIKAAKNVGPVLERMGYELVDLIYTRRLDHGSNSRTDRRVGGSGCSGDEGDFWQDTGPATRVRPGNSGGPVARVAEGQAQAAAPVGHHSDHPARAG